MPRLNSLPSLRLLVTFAGVFAAPFAVRAATSAPAATYRVKQTVTLSDIPADAGLVRWWIALPDDQRHQEVLDLVVSSAPGTWQMVREPKEGNRFLYLEVPAPATESISATIDFTVRRDTVFTAIDPSKVGPLTDSHRRALAAELRLDAPHMQVTPAIAALAEAACADETNPARQARLLLDAVATRAEHYGKDPAKPRHSPGDASACLLNGGGTCTDLHSLFIALARSRGIPARLQMGYRLLPRNDGREVDPGYRCWAEYFLPGYGWVSADIVEADSATGELREHWLAGLTNQRVWLNRGRDFAFSGHEGPINSMAIGFALIDGRPARVLPDGDQPAQLSRRVWFESVAD